jgi:hypothetical protein
MERGDAESGRQLHGMIRSVTEAGPLWSAQVALDGSGDLNTALALPFSAREWQALGLAPGDAVTLTLTAGVARLVTADGDAAQTTTEETRQ